VRVKPLAVLPVLAAVFIGQAWMQKQLIYPFWKKHYAPRKDSDLSSLSPDQMLFALAGLREMIAGLLWVRADNYFDEGNYDAILPMVRIVTMLDPKQIDVYATGMWHIAYNFTDEAQRSDRRYVAPAIALGKEGARLNEYTYELWFETGWIWYHKVDDDYQQAVHYFEKAGEYDFESMYAGYKRDGASDLEALQLSYVNAIPPARANLLGLAYQRNGQIYEALDRYQRLLAVAQKKMGTDPFHEERINRDTLETNLDNLLVRMSQRGFFAKERGASLVGYDVDPPYDVGFSARVTVIDPRVIVAEGTWGVLPVGTRVRFILRDKDFPNAVPGGMVWDQGDDVDFRVNNRLTYLQDALFVKNQRFTRKIDMGRDVTMYPFATDSYVIEFYYNPRSAPAHIQDKFGFSGEGMTDKLFLNEDIRPGQRVVFAQLEISKDMINMTGEYRRGRGKPAFVQTQNYNDRLSPDTTDVIDAPGLRSEGATRP
jgi:hypothetical protein